MLPLCSSCGNGLHRLKGVKAATACTEVQICKVIISITKLFPCASYFMMLVHDVRADVGGMAV